MWLCLELTMAYLTGKAVWLLALVTNFRSFAPPGAQRSANQLVRGHTVKHLPVGVGATTKTKVAARRSFRLNIVVIDPYSGRAQETPADGFLLVTHFDYLNGFPHSLFSKHLAEACKR